MTKKKNIDLEELQRMLDKAQGSGSKKKAPAKKKKATTKKKPPAQKDSTKTNRNPKNVYQTVHFYTLPSDSWQNVVKDGKEERQLRSDTVVVNVHNHMYNEECSGSCHEVI